MPPSALSGWVAYCRRLACRHPRRLAARPSFFFLGSSCQIVVMVLATHAKISAILSTVFKSVMFSPPFQSLMEEFTTMGTNTNCCINFFIYH